MRCRRRRVAHRALRYHSSVFRPHREMIRRFFAPVPDLAVAVERAVARLRSSPGRVIGVHVRRGDYVQSSDGAPAWRDTGPFFATPMPWLREALRSRTAASAGEVTLLVCSDDATPVLEELSEFRTCSAAQALGDSFTREGDERAWAEMLLLSRCDELLVSNSTFSFFAALLGEDALECWRPDPAASRFVCFDPWDAYPLLGAARAPKAKKRKHQDDS